LKHTTTKATSSCGENDCTAVLIWLRYSARRRTSGQITGILCQIITGNVGGAGTDGRVYLGLGGREFRLDSSADDYERGSWREYILGVGPVEPNLPPPQVRVQNKDKNDQRLEFPLDTVNLGRSPVYIRFEPESSGDYWNLHAAAALVYAGQFVVGYTPPVDFDNLWMGQAMGKVLYLTQEWRGVGQMIRHLGRKQAGPAEQYKPRTRNLKRRRS
jgi:hypothetical protein